MSKIDFSRMITAPARKVMAEHDARQRARADAQSLLDRTDWMVVRAAECGTPVPPDMLQARKDARAVLSEPKAEADQTPGPRPAARRRR